MKEILLLNMGEDEHGDNMNQAKLEELRTNIQSSRVGKCNKQLSSIK